MSAWIGVPAFVATSLSIGGLGLLGWRGHRTTTMPSLCEMAAVLQPSLSYFRFVVWTCGALFAITMYGFVIPKSGSVVLMSILWTAELLGNTGLAAIPARPRTMVMHLFFAQLLGAAMLLLAYQFAYVLHGNSALAELLIALCMTFLSVGTYVDKRRYVFHQMPFIFLSHATILIAVVALR